jgi:hypothetical protein
MPLMNTRRMIVVGCMLAVALTACGRRRVERVSARTTQNRSASANYSVQWVANNAPSTMKRDETVPVQVTVKNTGDWPWPDPKTANPGDPSGAYAVRLGCAWKKADGGKAEPASTRADLAGVVPPGGLATFTIDVTAPKQAGAYDLELDLVEELVTWFDAKGAAKLRVPVTVE